ncbi:MAG: hypothetical protein AAF266_12255 [Planctomycetota bacterium]
MSNRLYTAAVIVGWLAAMTWLVTDRILPPFFGGDAPATRPSNQTEPVAWRIEMSGKPSGFAVMQAVPADGGTKEVHSFLQIDRIEAPKAAPVWLAPLIKSFRNLSFTMRTRTTYDTIDRLYAFETKMTVGQLESPVLIRGRVVSETLQLTVRVGDLIRRRFEHPWPSDGRLGSDLTPTGKLLPLYEGRRWTSEVFSPFASPGTPLELVEARVTQRLRFTDEEASTDAWEVEFRSLEKTGSTDKGRVRASLYVAEDGRVLKQEAYFLGSSITFLRRSDVRSAQLAKEHLQLEKYATTYEVPMDEGSPEPPGGPQMSPATESTPN